MRIFDIRPIDIEITTIFTLSELQDLYKVLSSAILRKDMFGDEYNTYLNFISVIEGLIKESENGTS